MSRVNFDQLLEAGVHFGHLKRKWNPAMAPYIFMERNGIHIIDLYKTVAKVDEAAEVMKITAKDLLELGIIEKIIPEYGGADDEALSSIAVYMHKCIREFLESYEGKSGEEIAKARYERFRKF